MLITTQGPKMELKGENMLFNLLFLLLCVAWRVWRREDLPESWSLKEAAAVLTGLPDTGNAVGNLREYGKRQKNLTEEQTAKNRQKTSSRVKNMRLLKYL